MKRLARFAVLCLLLAASVSCTSNSLTRDAYRGLSTAAAAYNTAEGARQAYCDPKPPPRPAICTDTNNEMRAAYATLRTGADLLATYLERRDEGTAQLLGAYVLKLPQLAIDLISISNLFAPPAPLAIPEPR